MLAEKTYQRGRHVLGRGMLAALALLLAGCAAPVKRPLALNPHFASLNIQRLTLLPIEFRNGSLDRIYQNEAAEEIRLRARSVLERKGYEVTLADASAGADAVVIIRVDHFLDEGLFSVDGPQYLEIYATASMLIAKDSTEVWRDEGVGMANTSFIAPTTLHMELTVAPAYLADSLFETLPKASSRRR